MLSDLTFEEITAGLDVVVEEILARCSWEQPPVDAICVAQALGITVALDDCQAGRARYVRLGDRSALRPKAAILLRSDPRLERRQWAVAHEIGEHTACRAFHRLGIDPCESSPRAREQIANQLAGRLLIPSHWFGKDAAALNWDLLALKVRYCTASHELIARRMLECRPAVIITIFDQGRITFRRGNLSGRVPPPSAAERSCWRLVHERNRPHVENDGMNKILGWPVHEADWKREILRYESAEWE
jgi:IrrE N-terminal-like domain